MGRGEISFTVSDEVAVHVSTFSYRLRMALALVEQDAMMQSPRTSLYIHTLLLDLREAAEHAASFIQQVQTANGPAPQAGVGEVSSDGHRHGGGPAGPGPAY